MNGDMELKRLWLFYSSVVLSFTWTSQCYSRKESPKSRDTPCYPFLPPSLLCDVVTLPSFSNFFSFPQNFPQKFAICSQRNSKEKLFVVSNHPSFALQPQHFSFKSCVLLFGAHIVSHGNAWPHPPPLVVQYPKSSYHFSRQLTQDLIAAACHADPIWSWIKND